MHFATALIVLATNCEIVCICHFQFGIFWDKILDGLFSRGQELCTLLLTLGSVFIRKSVRCNTAPPDPFFPESVCPFVKGVHLSPFPGLFKDIYRFSEGAISLK